MPIVRMRFIAVIATVLGCSMASDREGQALGRVVINADIGCPSCTIVFDSLIKLEGAYTNGPQTTMGHDPTSGLYYVTDAGDGLLKIYGSDGRFRRQIGQHGGGPGEYEHVRNVLFANDASIRVLDGVLGRLSVFSRNGDFLDSRRVPVHSGAALPAILLPDHRLVVNESPSTRAGPGHVLYVIDQNGQVTYPFNERAIDPRKQWLHERNLVLRANGELLVGRPFAFTVDVYGKDLVWKRSISRVAEWIPLQDPEGPPDFGIYDQPFTPRVITMWEDEEGLLWLRMWAPSPLWEPGPSRERVSRLQREDQDALRNRQRVETIVEVWDLERHRVLARYRGENAAGWDFGGGYFAFPEEDPVGEPSLRISRVRLNR